MLILISLFSIAIAILILLSNSSRYSAISKIIFVAFLLRILIMILGNYFITLPDSNKDAVGLERMAWSLAQDGFLYTLQNNFPGINSFTLPWLMSLAYSLVGRQVMIIQFIGIIFSISSIFLGWLIAKKLWKDDIAIKVGWTIALFPSLILYSVITLREVYISFFLLVAIYGLVDLIKFGSLKSIFWIIFGFMGSGFFHGALILGCIFLLMIFSFYQFKHSINLIINLRINLTSLFFIFLTAIILYLIISKKVYIPYISTFEDYPSLEWLLGNILGRMSGEASYGEWGLINSGYELIYKLPLRIAYFLFSPFPWNISKLSHIIGMLDGILYIFLIYAIFKNRKIISKDPALKLILLLLLFYFIMFSLGVSNFGAGIRHRSKFVIEMILLAGPLIPVLSLKKLQRQAD